MLCGVCRVEWSGVVWFGVVRFGLVWSGVVWCGVVRCGVVWCGVVWCGVKWSGVVCRVPVDPPTLGSLQLFLPQLQLNRLLVEVCHIHMIIDPYDH